MVHQCSTSTRTSCLVITIWLTINQNMPTTNAKPTLQFMKQKWLTKMVWLPCSHQFEFILKVWSVILLSVVCISMKSCQKISHTKKIHKTRRASKKSWRKSTSNMVLKKRPKLLTASKICHSVMLPSVQFRLEKTTMYVSMKLTIWLNKVIKLLKPSLNSTTKVWLITKSAIS